MSTTNVATTTPSSCNNWIQWVDSRESELLINKQHQEQLFNAFHSTLSNEECKRKILDHQETVFLFKENFGACKMNVFHHLKIVGGTVYDATVDIGFVQGVGQETSLTMTPDIDILCDKSGGAAVPVPTMTTIMGVTTVEEVDAMTNGASTTFRPRNIIPIPPFLLKVIVEMISRRVQDATELLVKVVQEIKAFDAIHATEKEFRDKAKQNVKILFTGLI